MKTRRLEKSLLTVANQLRLKSHLSVMKRLRKTKVAVGTPHRRRLIRVLIVALARKNVEVGRIRSHKEAAPEVVSVIRRRSVGTAREAPTKKMASWDRVTTAMTINRRKKLFRTSSGGSERRRRATIMKVACVLLDCAPGDFYDFILNFPLPDCFLYVLSFQKLQRNIHQVSG